MTDKTLVYIKTCNRKRTTSRNRQKLWNSVEKVERRKDATLAREFEIAFPNELNAEQRKSMLDDLCKKLVEKYGAVVDAAIHAPHKNSGSDERNYHAHIMFTTRSIDLETGEFSAKKFRDFNKEGAHSLYHKFLIFISFNVCTSYNAHYVKYYRMELFLILD